MTVKYLWKTNQVISSVNKKTHKLRHIPSPVIKLFMVFWFHSH